MNNETLDKLIELADGHQAADEYVAGSYDWHGGSCAIGCTIRDAVALGILREDTDYMDREALAQSLGLPSGIMVILDHEFEHLPESDRPSLTPAVLRGIKAAKERDADFDAILRTHARLTIARADTRIGDGDEPWRVECRAVVAMAADVLRTRWLNKAEAGRAEAAAEAAWTARIRDTRFQRGGEASMAARMAWSASDVGGKETGTLWAGWVVWAAPAAWGSSVSRDNWVEGTALEEYRTQVRDFLALLNGTVEA